jgi:hypothetical protein
MSDNDYDSSDVIGMFYKIIIHRCLLSIDGVRSDADGYDLYDDDNDDQDPFQDDNNNNYTTSVNTNDPEQFEYLISQLTDIQARFESTAFPSSYIQAAPTSSSVTCSICLKNQTNFESLVCQHVFCHDCWSQYIDTNFQYRRCISKQHT